MAARFAESAFCLFTCVSAKAAVFTVGIDLLSKSSPKRCRSNGCHGSVFCLTYFVTRVDNDDGAFRENICALTSKALL